jgi:hypothetical protein
MTALEMKYKFDIKMRELLKALNHPFTTSEINRLLNEAQLKIVLDYYKHYEQSEEIRKILSALVTPYTTSTFAAGTHENGYLVTLPTDLVDVLEESVNNILKVKVMTLDEYTINIRNPFKKPFTDTSDSTVPGLVWRLDVQDTHELITDGVTQLGHYDINYLKYPPDIDIDNSVDCVLNASIHEDIINLAIQIALEIIARTTTKQ